MRQVKPSIFAAILVLPFLHFNPTLLESNLQCLPDSTPSIQIVFGRPTGTPPSNDLVVRELYELSSNDETKFADWVAFFLDGSTFGSSGNVHWGNDPCIDPTETLEAVGASGDDMSGAYSQYRYDRGHLAANASFAGSPLWSDINYYSNMVPQHETLNRGAWASLESAIRGLVSDGQDVYVLTGTIYEEPMPDLPNADESHKVPSDFWKIVTVVQRREDGSIEEINATAFLFDQHGCVVEQDCEFSSDFLDARVPINEIEMRSADDMISTNLDFFSDLPEDIENELERGIGSWPPSSSMQAQNPGSSEVALSRLMPNPSGEEPATEWIEVCNQGESSVDVSGWRVSDEQASYTYPGGTVLAAQGDTGDCEMVFGETYNPTNSTRGLQLRNSGETVTLRNASGVQLDTCTYGTAGTNQIKFC
jgi:endonuclease G